MEEDPPAGVPEWVLTYGDMMSLLLCFFILLAAFSQMRTEQEQNSVVESLIRTFGDTARLRTFLAMKSGNRMVMEAGAVLDDVKRKNSHERMQALSGSTGPPGRATRVRVLRDGSRRNIVGGPILFDDSATGLTADAEDALTRIADHLRDQRDLIEVRGYPPPADLATPGGGTDPERLAYQRARAVMDFLATSGRLPRGRLRLALAAPIESTTLAVTDGEEPMLERVDVTTLSDTPQAVGSSGITGPLEPVPAGRP